uniref:Uncharacterized protein n=1 Tax=Anguilla anguilla TaxID=7936 RepID=A0A0E9Q420_ANGAN
MYPTQLPN